MKCKCSEFYNLRMDTGLLFIYYYYLLLFTILKQLTTASYVSQNESKVNILFFKNVF